MKHKELYKEMSHASKSIMVMVFAVRECADALLKIYKK